MGTGVECGSALFVLTDVDVWFSSQQQLHTLWFVVQTAVMQSCVSSVSLSIQVSTADRRTH